MAETKQAISMDSEEQIISRAQSAVSQCNWVVGECAAAWTEKYAKGRTDADFAALVGLSADQIYQRRRVAETFADVRESFPSLKWSHYYVALKWDDAPECLQWAEENEATVAEMSCKLTTLSPVTRPQSSWVGGRVTGFPWTTTSVLSRARYRAAVAAAV